MTRWRMGGLVQLDDTGDGSGDPSLGVDPVLMDLLDPVSVDVPTHSRYWGSDIVITIGSSLREIFEDLKREDPRVVDLLNRMWHRNFRRRCAEFLLSSPPVPLFFSGMAADGESLVES